MTFDEFNAFADSRIKGARVPCANEAAWDALRADVLARGAFLAQFWAGSETSPKALADLPVPDKFDGPVNFATVQRHDQISCLDRADVLIWSAQ